MTERRSHELVLARMAFPYMASADLEEDQASPVSESQMGEVARLGRLARVLHEVREDSELARLAEELI